MSHTITLPDRFTNLRVTQTDALEAITFGCPRNLHDWWPVDECEPVEPPPPTAGDR